MANSLVIVESPAKVKTIKKFLGSTYEVDASGGHVRDLPKSTLGVDVENDYEPKYITIRGKGDVLAKLRKEVKKADKIYILFASSSTGRTGSRKTSYTILNSSGSNVGSGDLHAGNVIWLACNGGLPIFYAILGGVLCVTIVGIPFGKQCFKLMRLSALPFGAEVN